MIKIFFFIDTTLASGGAEKVLCKLVNNLSPEEFDVTVQTLWPEDAERYLAPNVHYRSVFPVKNKLNKLRFRIEAQLGQVYENHIKGDYDIEIAYLECGPTKIISRSSNQQAVKLAWVHCDLQRMTDDPAVFAEKARKWYAKFDKVVCVSEHVMKSFRSLFGEEPQSLVLYNTVDDAEIRKKANAPAAPTPRQGRLVAATVGRMYYAKGYDRLLEAHHRLLQDGILYDLWILGEGPERSILEKIVQDYGMEDTVHFLGFQQNPYPFMQAADLIVCSSRYEGFSTVVTEALILGKPVVTTPCSGMQELLGDSQYGLITEDSVEGIYAGMKKMLEDPDLRENYAQAAKLRGKAFSKAERIAETESFFRSVLEEKQKR